jgi:hypothetical protein
MKITPDMKRTIGKIVAMQAVATEAGHNIMLTRAMLRIVLTGLAIKFDQNVPEQYLVIFDKANQSWQLAVTEYGSSNENWPISLMRCAKIADEMSIIAGLEDLMDYREFENNISLALTHPPSMDDHDQHGEYGGEPNVSPG